jgi:hypothetical protein
MALIQWRRLLFVPPVRQQGLLQPSRLQREGYV